MKTSTVVLEFPTMEEKFTNVVGMETSNSSPALLVITHSDGEVWMFPVERIHSVHCTPDPDPAQSE